MYEFHKFYINGDWVDPIESRHMDVIDPSNEEIVGRISLGSSKDADNAVAAARVAFADYAQTSRDERIALLRRILEVYEIYRSDIARAISHEMGAPTALATGEQAPCGAWHIATIIDALSGFEFEEQLGSTRVVKEAIGVCALITPWNWPISQIVWKVAQALAAGCTMVLKPSEMAPLSAYLFSEVLDEAGVPKGVYNMINGDGPLVGARLAAHPDVDMISITGSVPAGVQVAQAAAVDVKRVVQELGGKSAYIILDDADLQKAVTDGVLGCFDNAGQCCNAPTRMLVPAALHDRAVEIARSVAEKVTFDDDGGAFFNIGPQSNSKQYDKVQRLICEAMNDGVRLVCGGPGRPEGIQKGYYTKPTIFCDVTNDMTIAREEFFGPVLAIIPYEDEDEAVQIANGTVYGLSGYVLSRDLDRARRLARRLRTGMVHLNNAPMDSRAPFGGYKHSGNGRERGIYGMNEYLEAKSIAGYSPEN